MQKQKQKRYIRPNALDYILTILAVLLLVSLAGRAIAMHLENSADRDCQASVSFILHDIEEEEKNKLLAAQVARRAVFTLPDGSRLDGCEITDVRRTVNQVQDEDGNFQDQPSAASTYDITFTLSPAEGRRAKDGTFLLGGRCRLAVGDKIPVVLDKTSYPADFIKVRIF